MRGGKREEGRGKREEKVGFGFQDKLTYKNPNPSL
jgi:hypothetical protein